MLGGQGNYGFDAARKEYVDLVEAGIIDPAKVVRTCLLYTSPSPRDRTRSRMPSSA